MNVYAPPGLSHDFITKAFSELSELDFAQSVARGDLNCILDPCIDTLPGENINPTKQAGTTTDTCEGLGYVDLWQTINPNNKEFTFYSETHKSSSKIDYLFALKTMWFSVLSCDIESITISEHAPV